MDEAKPPVAVALRATSRSGSVLVLALWVLFFLAALAIAVGAHVAAGLRLAGSLKQDALTYPAARAGVTHAALAVAANTNAWDGLGPAAWNGDPAVFTDIEVLPDVAYSVVNVRVTPDGAVTNPGLVGVEARLCINRFDARIFDALLDRAAGMDAEGAAALREAMAGYLDSKTERLLTTESGSAYAQGSGRVRARFESLNELLRVEGMDAGRFERLAPYLTVFGSGKVNVNAAPDAILLACAEAYPAAAEAIEKVRAAREAGEALTERGELGAVAFLVLKSTAFEGLAIGRGPAETQESRIGFVVDAQGRRLYWREE